MERTLYANGTTANDNGNDCKIKNRNTKDNKTEMEQNKMHETNQTICAKSDQPEI